MKNSNVKFVFLVALLLLGLAVIGISQPAKAAPSANQIRISQVYGGGGNIGATYTHDFIEIFNSGTTSVNLSGWSLQYASSSGNTWQVTPMAGTIGPGHYFLIQESAGAGGTTPLPTPDVAGSINMSATTGKVALVSSSVALSGTCPTGGAVVDFVGYGGANCFEGGGAAPTLTNATAAVRGGAGCTDSDHNANDFTAGAPNPRNSASPTNVCSADQPPTVSSTTPLNGATAVTIDANLNVTFSEAVNVAGSWFTIDCAFSGLHTAVATPAPPTAAYTLNPNADFVAGDVCNISIHAGQVTDIDGAPDPMSGDYTWRFNVVGACSSIPTIQGFGAASPCENQSVSNIQGCIIGIANNGFYFQDVAGDGNQQSSDGLFVYGGFGWDNPSGWQVGNLVSVNGQIIEFFDITEFEFPNTVVVTDDGVNCGGTGLPAPVSVSPILDPWNDPSEEFETYESMRASMSFDGWVVGATKRFASRFTPGDPEIAFVNFNSLIPDYARVFESDYPGYQGINYLSGGLNVDLPDLDFGDEISASAVTGVFAYNFDKYTLLAESPPTLTTLDRPDVTAVAPALNPAFKEFDICFFNVENLFDNINDGQGDWGDWAPGYPTSGSPAGAALYQVKLAATAAAIVNEMQSCMVIGVQEVEGKGSVYADLATAVSTADSSHTWSSGYVESGDPRDISQGYLYRDDVTLVGSINPVSGPAYEAMVTDGVLDFRRAPATALFRFHTGSAYETDIQLFNVHFKSKRTSSSCTVLDCTDVREKEAADLRDILAQHQILGQLAAAGGDFNDVIDSSPIGILDASLDSDNLFYDLPAAEQWSYVFNGESEVLDHIYATTDLLLASTSGWAHAFNPIHVYADYPSSERPSDHDPVRVRFAACDLSPASSAAPAPTLSLIGAWARLNWAYPFTYNGGYSVLRSETPYAAGVSLSQLPQSAVAFTDTSATGVGDPLTNHFYTLRLLDSCGGSLHVDSGQVGEFDFAIQPGT